MNPDAACWRDKSEIGKKSTEKPPLIFKLLNNQVDLVRAGHSRSGWVAKERARHSDFPLHQHLRIDHNWYMSSHSSLRVVEIIRDYFHLHHLWQKLKSWALHLFLQLSFIPYTTTNCWAEAPNLKSIMWKVYSSMSFSFNYHTFLSTPPLWKAAQAPCHPPEDLNVILKLQTM